MNDPLGPPGGAEKKPLSTGGFFVHSRRPVKASDYFALPASLSAFRTFFPGGALPWEWLKQIGPALMALPSREGGPKVPAGVHLEGRVHIDPSVSLPNHATIIGPVWIGAATEIRPGAFIRGNVIAGEGCVLGNASEFKNCLLMDGVQAPHFNYVGDSILGNRAHLGAGAICSNLRLDHRDVAVHLPTGAVETGLRKLGAIIGDDAQVGCNAVLNPGTLLGPRSLVMPAMAFGGFLAPSMIARARLQVTVVPRKD
jgi:UDP-N-acetylglucosamine diphosphorylase / glucose-1-phosphate thymidylyltransferase / UDP-N-acetylgalactosamine diphosphorylase / glucosamine-1-phosphate N-acetyltransferase / galactosamine-1-phosphate N-acetyltransferase